MHAAAIACTSTSGVVRGLCRGRELRNDTCLGSVTMRKVVVRPAPADAQCSATNFMTSAMSLSERPVSKRSQYGVRTYELTRVSKVTCWEGKRSGRLQNTMMRIEFHVLSPRMYRIRFSAACRGDSGESLDLLVRTSSPPSSGRERLVTMQVSGMRFSNIWSQRRTLALSGRAMKSAKCEPTFPRTASISTALPPTQRIQGRRDRMSDI